MVETGVFGQIASGLFEKVFSGVLWFGIAIIIIGVLSGVIWYFFVYKKKFDIKVIIKSNRASDRYGTIFDKAAILTDRKTKTPYLRVWGLQRDFPIPKFDELQKTNEGDLLEMFRKSENEFLFLRPSVINKQRVIRADGKTYAIAEQGQTMVDPEMGFWAAKRKDLNKKMFSPESILMKVLPYLPSIFGGVITIFILYILLDHLPTILASLKELVDSMNTLQQGSVTPAVILSILKWNNY